jgi:hypothetical protein
MRALALLFLAVLLGWIVGGVEWSREAIGAETKSLLPGADVVAGEMIVLDEFSVKGDKPAVASEVNVGGLIAICIDDTAGKPTKFDELTIRPENALQRLGKLRSVQNESGAINLSGSGFTWLLYTPVRTGDVTISLKCFPNDQDGAVARKHQVKIVEAKN